jgi:beta-mannosidase
MTALLVVLAALAAFGSVRAGSLADHPVVGDSIIYLDGMWKANNDALGLSINAGVPGDLLTDLQTAGLIGDPLYELNFKNSSLWTNYTWTYETGIYLPLSFVDNSQELLLVFDGIKMGANILVNGKQVGTATDQFLRYSFPLKALDVLVDGFNLFQIQFDPSLDVDGRFMAWCVLSFLFCF